MPYRALWLVSFALAFDLAGCATVAPYERELLAKRCMAPDGEPSREALGQHYLSTREGAVGGMGGGGGGCGCN